MPYIKPKWKLELDDGLSPQVMTIGLKTLPDSDSFEPYRKAANLFEGTFDGTPYPHNKLEVYVHCKGFQPTLAFKLTIWPFNNDKKLTSDPISEQVDNNGNAKHDDNHAFPSN